MFTHFVCLSTRFYTLLFAYVHILCPHAWGGGGLNGFVTKTFFVRFCCWLLLSTILFEFEHLCGQIFFGLRFKAWNICEVGRDFGFRWHRFVNYCVVVIWNHFWVCEFFFWFVFLTSSSLWCGLQLWLLVFLIF